MKSIKQIFKRNRCDFCKRKCGFFPFVCKCGGKFCSEHRHIFMHVCHNYYNQKHIDRSKVYLPKFVKENSIFGDSLLTSLDMSGKTGNESSHILLFQNHETVV